MNNELSILTYIVSKKQDIIKINDEYSFQVVPFWMEWNGQKGEINCIKVKNDNVRYDGEQIPKGHPINIDEYRKHAPEASQTWSNYNVSIFFGEGVAWAKIEGSTLIIDGSHWVGYGNSIYLSFFELLGMEELTEGSDNKLVLKIKERKIVNSHSHKFFAPTITSLLINFGDKKVERDQYKANLQIGKKYDFKDVAIENIRILDKRLDLNNSVDKIPELRVFKEEPEIITHGSCDNNQKPTDPNKSNQPTNTELENIKNIFQKLDIKKASFKNGELVIKYNNNNNNNKIITNNQLTNNSEYQVLKNYCQELPEKEITKEQLFTNSDNLQSNPNKNNHYLAIGLTLGAGTIALVSILVCLWKPKKSKH